MAVKHLKEDDFNSIKSIQPIPKDDDLPPEFKWFDKPFGLPQHIVNIFILGVVPHSAMLIWGTLILRYGAPYIWPMLPMLIVGYTGGLGITVGSHRYWTHKSFKANKALQILLMLMQTLGGQYPIFKWCRDHRVHHKYTDTNADPHSSSRGFWFSHMSWFFHPPHPDVTATFKTIAISDLAKDPIVRFQSRHYGKLLILVFFLIPMWFTHYFHPYLTTTELLILRLAGWGTSNHWAATVNSVAHLWGDKPYDKFISPSDNPFVSLLAAGEGWHNFHHTFPWDYKAAEFPFKINLSTFFIHFFAAIGWAWDLKSVSHKILADRINRTGSRHHKFHENQQNLEDSHQKSISIHPQPSFWGWGDKELTAEQVEITETLYFNTK